MAFFLVSRGSSWFCRTWNLNNLRGPCWEKNYITDTHMHTYEYLEWEKEAWWVANLKSCQIPQTFKKHVYYLTAWHFFNFPYVFWLCSLWSLFPKVTAFVIFYVEKNMRISFSSSVFLCSSHLFGAGHYSLCCVPLSAWHLCLQDTKKVCTLGDGSIPEGYSCTKTVLKHLTVQGSDYKPQIISH